MRRPGFCPSRSARSGRFARTERAEPVAGRAADGAPGDRDRRRRGDPVRRGRRRRPVPRRPRLRRCRSVCRRPSPIRCRARSRSSSPGTPAPTARSSSGRSANASACPRRGSPACLMALEAEGRVVRGEFRPEGVRREWCDSDVLRQLRRRSLATLRREVEPVEHEALARFLPAWQGIPAQRKGVDAVVEALGVLAGRADRRLHARQRRARRTGGRLPPGPARRAVHVRRRAVGRGRRHRLRRRPGAPVLRRPAAAVGARVGGAGSPGGCSARRRPHPPRRARRQLLEPAPGRRARRPPTTSCWRRCGISSGPAR